MPGGNQARSFNITPSPVVTASYFMVSESALALSI